MAETLDKIKSLASRIFGGGKSEAEKGEGLQRPVTPEMATYDKVTLKYDRRSVIQKCTEMEKSDPRIARMLQKIPADAVVGGMTISVDSATNDSTKEQAQKAIDDLLSRCQVGRKMKGWLNSMLREGDLFLEVIADDSSKEIVRLKKLAAIITFSNMNSEGNYPDGKPAYYQEHPLSGQKIKEFEHWQVCQMSWEYEDGKPYGTPLFASARLSWERLDNAEKNLVVRRAVRAGLKRHHKVGTPERPGTWEEVVEYRNMNKDTLANPQLASQDFYSTGTVDIAELTGDTTLDSMADIAHFEGLLSMIGGVPQALLGGGREKSINRDVLEEQEEDYYRVIADVDDTFEYGLRQIIDFQLLLAGINDESISYTFKWGAKDRDDVDAKVARALNLQKLGYSFETIFTICALDEVNIEDELERIEKQVEEGIIPYGIGLKLDPNIMALLGATGAVKGEDNEKLMERIGRIADLSERQLSSSGTMKNLITLNK